MHNITTHFSLQMASTSLILHEAMLMLFAMVHTNHIASHCNNYSIPKVVSTEVVGVTMQSCQLHTLECVHFKGQKISFGQRDSTFRSLLEHIAVALLLLLSMKLGLLNLDKYLHGANNMFMFCTQSHQKHSQKIT